MLPSFFVSDLHGRTDRYRTLFELVRREVPRGVFFGGDLLPHGMDLKWRTSPDQADFLEDFLLPEFRKLRRDLGDLYPRMFVILGNDDPRIHEETLLEAEQEDLLSYIHGKKAPYGPFSVYGYSCIPPSPFQLKDWERYDVSRYVDPGCVSRYVDPGCVSPEEGRRTTGPDPRVIRNTTIELELGEMAGDDDLSGAICLFHCPPYNGRLDRAALDGRKVDHVPLDVHIGSIAVERFIDERQPLLSLHGHVHESRTLTGHWRETRGRTQAISAATEKPQLALVRFDPHEPGKSTIDLC